MYYLYICFIHFISLLHPFYVSVTDVKHNSKSKNLEISCRIFTDDLEAALVKKYQTKLNILKPGSNEQADKFILDYLQKHLQVKVEGKIVPLTYLGFEIEGEAAWCYLEAPNIAQVKNIEIKNDILFEEHAGQTNMVHVTIKNIRKSTKLDNPENTFSLSF
ncbi:DUF6702 family protein [Adhaeribacter aquaticus]|uniref:DUF6702 family protein n=1 Tax=Adhaeribacter aquaticus TaxID=299567 RepID=UPI0003FBDC56|nr:DUF6702 family protein [Adhaeribacter aquaticus]